MAMRIDDGSISEGVRRMIRGGANVSHIEFERRITCRLCSLSYEA